MKAYERWTLQVDAGGAELRLEQDRNASINVIFGASMVGVAAWLLARPGNAVFGGTLLLFGALWVLLAFVAGRQVRIVGLGAEQLTRKDRSGTVKERWPRSRAAAVELSRKPRKKGSDSPLPWRVEIVDGGGVAFGTTFRFQDEGPARAFTSELASLLDVPVHDGEGAPAGDVDR